MYLKSNNLKIQWTTDSQKTYNSHKLWEFHTCDTLVDVLCHHHKLVWRWSSVARRLVLCSVVGCAMADVPEGNECRCQNAWNTEQQRARTRTRLVGERSGLEKRFNACCRYAHRRYAHAVRANIRTSQPTDRHTHVNGERAQSMQRMRCAQKDDSQSCQLLCCCHQPRTRRANRCTAQTKLNSIISAWCVNISTTDASRAVSCINVGAS